MVGVGCKKIGLYIKSQYSKFIEQFPNLVLDEEKVESLLEKQNKFFWEISGYRKKVNHFAYLCASWACDVDPTNRVREF